MRYVIGFESLIFNPDAASPEWRQRQGSLQLSQSMRTERTLGAEDAHKLPRIPGAENPGLSAETLGMDSSEERLSRLETVVAGTSVFVISERPTLQTPP